MTFQKWVLENYTSHLITCGKLLKHKCFTTEREHEVYMDVLQS